MARAGSYYLWRKAVFERDCHKCVLCGSTDKLEADHILPYSKHPDLHLEISNGRTLCKPCHKATDTYGGKMLRGTRRDGDPYGTR